MRDSKPAITAAAKSPHAKYLIFSLDGKGYGVEFGKAREVVGFTNVIAVPGRAPRLRGTLKIRGEVIGVVDLRACLGMPSARRTKQTKIIVVEIRTGGRNVTLGVVVDRASEVLNIPRASIRAAPGFTAGLGGKFVRGKSKFGGRVNILVDIDRLLNRREASEVAAAVRFRVR